MGNIDYSELVENVPSLNGMSSTAINEIVAEISFAINSDGVSENHKHFQKWWDTYPSNDGYLHWMPTRSLKIDRALCISLYAEAAKVHGHAALQRALENEIMSRRMNSNNANEFRFMPSTKSYLEKSQYEGFLNFDSPMTGDLGAQSRVKIN